MIHNQQRFTLVKQMTLRRYIVVLLLALSLLAGCKKKQKPQPPAPPPTIVPQAEAAPPQQTQQPQTEVKPEQQSPQQATSATNPPPKPKPRTRKPRQKPSPSESPGTEVAKATPPKPIAPPPEESGLGDISTKMPNGGGEQLNSQTTEQLLKSTEDNLNKIKRTLNVNEQSMLKHIRGFIVEAKQALLDGDAVRAHNLALKARQLSQELVTP